MQSNGKGNLSSKTAGYVTNDKNHDMKKPLQCFTMQPRQKKAYCHGIVLEIAVSPNKENETI